ncbi:helix-hairpin-helix domain-containing protein [bacterium]|nr:helix-hairpin-helix domain-containing protein [bacterium]
MDRLEFTLVVALVLAIAGGVGYRHWRDSRPPLQPVVIYGRSQFTERESMPRPEVVASAAAAVIDETTPPAVAPAPVASSPMHLDGALVLLNQADLARLQDVPGIGPVMAQRIMAARQARGGFINWRELSEVSGIGDKRLEEIRNSFMLEAQKAGGPAALIQEP